MDGKIAAELVAVAKALTAGDEWTDENTVEFARKLAAEMKRDRNVSGVSAQGPNVRFTFHVALAAIPLVMKLTEFGYEGESESVSGTIVSEENSTFRVPGGGSYKRDPAELWKEGKSILVDIFEKALNR